MYTCMGALHNYKTQRSAQSWKLLYLLEKKNKMSIIDKTKGLRVELLTGEEVTRFVLYHLLGPNSLSL